MKVALLYPPPWMIPDEGGGASYGVDGPPPEYRPGDLDADFYQIPCGRLQPGAEAKRAGHATKVLNLSSFPWSRVEEVLDQLDADVFGLSCWTANRRGVGYVATWIQDGAVVPEYQFAVMQYQELTGALIAIVSSGLRPTDPS